jgi:hypothetical protein
MSSDKESKGNQEDEGSWETEKSKGIKHLLPGEDLLSNKTLKTSRSNLSILFSLK